MKYVEKVCVSTVLMEKPMGGVRGGLYAGPGFI